MQESFLHFIWQHQYFTKDKLVTTNGELVRIFSPGIDNSDAGPDFTASQLEIDGIKWAGNVEIHIKSSYWKQHNHHKDEAYDNVVLHVVWEHDYPVARTDGTVIPTLELKGRISENLIQRCNELTNSREHIPCASQIHVVDKVIVASMLDRVLMERLERKAIEIQHVFTITKSNWEETAYRMLCKNFGFKTNAQPFEQLATVVPVNILRKHADSILQIEAMLFGQAGFLDKITTDYQLELEQEYRFLAHKYNLTPNKLNGSQWKFARLRPANFPVLRIAQLAAVLQSTYNLFSSLLEIEQYKDAQKIFRNKLSPFWQNHYNFNNEAEGNVPQMGSSSIENIIINTIAPLLVAYGKSLDNQIFIDKAITLLESTKAEKNKIIRYWDVLGLKVKSAFDSQGQIELYNNYCMRKNCLKCAVGNHLIKNAIH